MKESKINNRVIWILALLVIPLCLLTTGSPGMHHHRSLPVLKYLNDASALSAYSLFALTFVLSARVRWLERYFGGLDKMYRTHHKMAIVAFLLICIHPFLSAAHAVLHHMRRFFLSVFPVHHEMAVNLGSYSLWGIVFLMVLTLAVKPPYKIWKISHKFMGLFFILALLHTFLLTVTFAENPLLWIYLLIVSSLGLAAFIYQTFLFRVLNRGPVYQVDFAEKITGDVLSIGLTSLGKKIDFRPGQFCFFSFRDSGISPETHPYTLFSSERNGDIQVMVKSLGDYTSRLYSVIKPGVKARVFGPYGCFVFNAGYRSQVWIGGGVGIAPFISWMRYLKQNPPHGPGIRLYYCVHKREDAVFLEEFQQFRQCCPNFDITLICTEERKRLSVEEIADLEGKEFFLCGPGPMCRSIVKDLERCGVSEARIHYENFDF